MSAVTLTEMDRELQRAARNEIVAACQTCLAEQPPVSDDVARQVVEAAVEYLRGEAVAGIEVGDLLPRCVACLAGEGPVPEDVLIDIGDYLDDEARVELS